VAQFLLIPKRIGRAMPALGRASQWLEAQVFRFIFWFVGTLSPERATALAAFAFGLIGPHTAKAEKADKNLAAAFPEKSAHWRAQTARQIFRYLGKSAAELIKLKQIWDERDQRLQFDIAPSVQALIDAGTPIVFVSAHVGAWQLTNLLSLHCQLNISTVYAAESNPAMKEMMFKLRQSFGVKLIPTDAGMRPLLKELKAGNCIGLAMDTRLKTGQLLPFFGIDALTNTSAARLALRAKAALVPIRAQRLGGARYRITVYEPLQSANPQASADAQATDLSLQINSHFERWITDNPEQWICLKRRWPKAHKL
jgi:KDO2-lipid IV(A) lauroyltransferase